MVGGAAANDDEAMAAGERVLKCMVEANALSMRPESVWAQALPHEAFEHEGTSVVTAPSTMDLYLMRLLRPRLDKTLKERERKQQVSTWGVHGPHSVGQTGRSCQGARATLPNGCFTV